MQELIYQAAKAVICWGYAAIAVAVLAVATVVVR